MIINILVNIYHFLKMTKHEIRKSQITNTVNIFPIMTTKKKILYLTYNTDE